MQQAVLSCVRHQAPERLASEDDAIVALAGDRRFPPSKLAILVDELQAQGLDAEVALAGTGLTVETLRDPFTLTSCAQFMRACRQALKVYPGDDLGLRMGCRFRASSYGMYGYALLCSESVRKMWDRAMAYHPLSGGLLYTYVAGTTTPATTYSSVALQVANANPVVLDSAGRATVYLTPGASYKFVLTTSAGATVWTADNISAVPLSASSLDMDGTAGTTITAGQVVYLSDGSGSTTAGRWYLADADQTYSSSLAPAIGIAMVSLAPGDEIGRAHV